MLSDSGGMIAWYDMSSDGRFLVIDKVEAAS